MIEMTELISVIVPVYNTEKFLIRCVASIQNQSYSNLEIILVDDGSPDKSPAMCDVLQSQDKRIKVVHKMNGGLGFARNSGLDVASGNYVLFIDSDDWIGRDHVENLYRKAKEVDADIAIGGHTRVTSDGKEVPCPYHVVDVLFEGNRIIDELVLPLIGPVPDYPKDVQFESSSCMNLYRMEIIREHGLRFISERYAVAEDMYFNIDFLMRAERVVITNETGYFYFQNQGSISRKYDPRRFERTLRSYDTVKTLMARYGLVDSETYRAERTFLMRVRVAIRLVTLSDLPIKQKLHEIRMILSDHLVHKVLEDYPIYAMMPTTRLINDWMRTKNVLGVYCLIKARETIRQRRK